MSKYLIGELIGRGGMGQVHSSRDRYGRAVVVKRLRNTLLGNQSMADRLADEARLLERVMHHNVVRAVDRGNDPEGAPYLVMDHAAGISLSNLIEREGPLPVQRAYAIAAQLLAGLAAVHEANVVHADMKSSNVLIGEADRVTIIDFGLARTLNEDPDKDDVFAGTPAFMAPEVITGTPPQVGSDLYAVGVILYEMLTGRTPFADASDIFQAHVHDPVVPPSLRAPNRGISAAMDRIVLRTLAKTPAARFASAKELAAALDAAAAAEWVMSTVDLSSVRATREAPTVDLDMRQTLLKARRPATPMPAAEDPTPSVQTHDRISATLDRAGQLITNHQVKLAVEELERGLAALVPDLGSDLPLEAEAWRIESVLAALYDGLGKKERARRLAMSAHRHAIHIGCKVAMERTRVLVDRLEGKRQPVLQRLARGSGRFERRR